MVKILRQNFDSHTKLFKDLCFTQSDRQMYVLLFNKFCLKNAIVKLTQKKMQAFNRVNICIRLQHGTVVKGTIVAKNIVFFVLTTNEVHTTEKSTNIIQKHSMEIKRGFHKATDNDARVA